MAYAGLLEQEVWAIVQVPAASQATVDSWLQQAAALEAQRLQPSPTSSRPTSRNASDTGKCTGQSACHSLPCCDIQSYCVVHSILVQCVAPLLFDFGF